MMKPDLQASQPEDRKLRVWDLPLRLFHWVLLLVVACAILSVELGDVVDGAMDWHPRLGYMVLGLLVFRLIWGFVGGTHARFASFVRGPGAILAYLRSLKEKADPTIGHNPLGALSVLALLLSLGFQALSGLFLNDEDFFIEGPLYKHVGSDLVHTLREAHEYNATLLFILIGLHIAAILFYRVIKKDNLILPMVTGSKRVPAAVAAGDARGGSFWLGLVVAAVAAVAVYLLVTQA